MPPLVANVLPDGSPEGELEVLASTVRAATNQSAVFTTRSKTILFMVRVTAAGTGTLTPTIQVRNPVDGTFQQYNATPATIGGTGTFLYAVGPGVSAFQWSAAGAGAVTTNVNQAVALPMPRRWRVNVAHSDASDWTYAVWAVVMGD